MTEPDWSAIESAPLPEHPAVAAWWESLKRAQPAIVGVMVGSTALFDRSQPMAEKPTRRTRARPSRRKSEHPAVDLPTRRFQHRTWIENSVIGAGWRWHCECGESGGGTRHQVARDARKHRENPHLFPVVHA